uniref:Uncharacterized protein n=1 Tax=Anopheles culicifacies TaxID=139723 RepID=A0A182MNS8_9DIPT
MHEPPVEQHANTIRHEKRSMEALPESSLHRIILWHIPLLHEQLPCALMATRGICFQPRTKTLASRYVSARIGRFSVRFLLVADAAWDGEDDRVPLNSYRIENADPPNRKRSECFGN